MVNGKINLGKYPIIGLGAANAFAYITPSYYLNNYSIICIRKRQDLELIKKDIDVFCVEDFQPNVFVPRVNQKELLNLPVARKYILEKVNPRFFVRKTTPGTEKFSKTYPVGIIGNPREVRDSFENKLFFRNSLIEAGVTPIDAEIVSFAGLNFDYIKRLQKKFGKDIVLQIAELTHGGGVGTGFISSKEDFDQFYQRILSIKNGEVKRPVENVICMPHIQGTPASILGCVTKYGVIVGSIQTQIQDIAEVSNPHKGSGVYCGHDFAYLEITDNLYAQSEQIVRKFGLYLRKSKYRGIFGIDLIISTQDAKVYPVECNPRYTDALPTISLIAKTQGIRDLEYYHLMEHLGVEYNVDVQRVSESYKTNFNYSQILLMSKSNDWSKNQKDLRAGIYQMNESGIEFVKESYLPGDLANSKQFLLTDGVPFKNTVFKPRARIMRAIFHTSILEQDKVLRGNISKAIDLIYDMLDFVKIDIPKEYQK